MAIKVISTQPQNCNCHTCKSTLEFSYHDIEIYEINHDYLGDFDTVKGIKCPLCKTVIEIK
jgi:hypothetical protein